MGYQPSYTWRSILSARWVLERRAIWRVGNGTHIRIWEDRWLRGSHCNRLLQPRQAGSDLHRVSDLIDHNTRTWRHDIISVYFNFADVSNTLGVPLTMHNIDDKLIWPHTKHNHFSVKIAYHFITVQDSVSGVTTSSTPAFWQKLWRLKLPPHIKNFFWRPCHGKYLSYYAWLLLGTNDMANFSTRLLSPPPLSSDAAFFDWLVDRIMCDSPDVVMWIALICWTIWTGRNALIFQDKMYSPQESVLKSQSLFMEIQDSSTSPGCTQSHSLRIPRSREAYRWQCPSRHHYKMNTEVAKISDVEWSIGVVIRSDQGHLFMTGIKTILAPDEVAVAEALGIKWGLQIAQQCHVSKLEVETDL
ncbi:ribonuclease H [Senna tora]|uniref:Ribonuclease H n=1 Tax=Senna tora TaxID=362788 RepID=A0A834XGT8_9FABA|nr:ribonuclease H [Senna tora]